MAVRSLSTSTLNNNQVRYGRMSGVFGASPFSVEYVVIAGGGGGAPRFHSGGGGAGGYRSNVFGEQSGGGAGAEPKKSLPVGTYSITIGAGGAAVVDTSNGPDGSLGNNTTFDNLISVGGGPGGGNNASTPTKGGSGGGASGYRVNLKGSGTADQGFDGGLGFSNFSPGGGGGAGEAGQNAPAANQAGKGGDGVASLITGTSVFRAGGGGGSGTDASPSTAGLGGLGGGGDGGGPANANQGQAGGVNTGGGGGGSNTATGGAGGSGVVIFKLPRQALVSFSAGVTHTVTPVGPFNVYTVTQTDPGSTVTIA